jgi:hypothetical protein
MGRRKDLKQRQANAAGRARNRAREAAAASGDSGGPRIAAVDPATENECPKCGALPGEACKTPSGKLAAKTHAARG